MKEQRPKVSVIIPVYNAEKYLKRCLDSIVNQTLKDIEIILINDGSTDNSESIIDMYRADNRLTVIKQLNQGVSKARNKGIKEAKGEYITFVDGDDWINLDMLNRMYALIKKYHCDLVMCAYMREFQTHSRVKEFSINEIEVFQEEKLKYELYRKLFGPIDKELRSPESLDSYGTVWGKLYCSSIVKENKVQFQSLKEIGTNEDSLFNIQVFPYIKKAVFINKPYYHYWRNNDNSVTGNYNSELFKKWSQLYLMMKKEIRIHQLDQPFYEALENRICISVLGLGMKECTNNLPIKEKIRNLKSILNNEEIKNAFQQLKLKNFPLHWRFFYFFNKKRWAISTFIMLNAINYLRSYKM